MQTSETGTHSASSDRLDRLAAEALGPLLERVRGEIGADRPLTLVIFELRGARAISDLFGEGAGAIALAQAVHRICTGLSGQVVVRRITESVHAAIVPDLATPEAVRRFCETVADVAGAPCSIGHRGVHLTAGIGAALCTTAREVQSGVCDPARMIAQALIALQTANANTSDGICLFDPEIERKQARRAAIESALHQAIAEERIDVHLQPIICIRRGCIAGCEALARWIDPELGFVPPDEFIAIAEARGFIDELFRIVLDKALRAARQWPDGLYVAVNLSPSQMADSHTARVILSALRRHRMDPKRLEIEITESAVIADKSTADRIIADLKSAGVRISLDDFGTGQSSLNRLRHLPFDKLKIDRSFVQSIEHDKAAEAIVSAIIGMCRALDIRVIVEGVETVEQAAKMTMLGCDGIQGYLFRRPGPADEIAAFIHDHIGLASNGITLRQRAA